MKRNPLGTWRNKCDKQLQLIGKKNNPVCLLCGNQTQVMHHFFPKSVSSALRYEWDNLIPLCNADHMRLHQSGDPRYEQRIITHKGERWYEKLENHARDYVKTNLEYYKNIYEKLK